MLEPTLFQNLSPQELINQQLSQLHAMEKLLANEKKILEQHEPNSLTHIINQKNELVGTIQALDNFISLNTPFAQAKAKGHFENELAEIAESLARCQKKNIVNGSIIKQSQLAVDRMKTSLLDRHNKSAVTYDGEGKKHASLSSLNLKA